MMRRWAPPTAVGHARQRRLPNMNAFMRGRRFFCPNGFTVYRGIVMNDKKLPADSALPPAASDVNVSRRAVIQKVIHGAGLVAGGSMLGLSTGGVWAAGSD